MSMSQTINLVTFYNLWAFSMQNSRPGEESIKSGDKSKSISTELASAINDGLYFYEQVEASVILIF